ncbi:MAG: ceramidase domain-containing protein [Hyphomicrobiales bacterium]|nr:ceramidase domain-containing protein [Hyphomicrobiales bacterium]
MDRLFAPLDIYCERLDASFWSEPFNALTNLLIVAAGLVGLAQVRLRETGVFAEVLCWWVVVIGLGSLLFHTTAIELTKWADILPIVTFTLALAVFCLRRFAGLSRARTIAYFLIFFTTISFTTYFLPPWLTQVSNGTTAYLPALAGFVFFGLVALVRGSRAGWYAISSAIILCMAFVCRAVDLRVCGSFPIGTHFLWHTLIALMLGVMLVAVSKYGHPRPEQSER